MGNMSVAEMLEADRKLAAEITPPYNDSAELTAARAAAARHSARLDAPVAGKKSGFDATARGVWVDDNQQRHPWTVTGRGETTIAALEDLVTKLDARAVVSPAGVNCPTCGQPLPQG